MSSNPLQHSSPPLHGRRPCVDVVRCGPKTNYQVRALIVSETVFGHMTHYRGRTVPCFAPHRPCQLCEDKRSRQWLGYVHATDPTHRVKRFLLEFTRGVMDDIQRFVDAYGTLRNAYCVVTRSHNHPTARLKVDLQPHRGCGPGDLPVAGDVADDLWRMWSGSLDAPTEGTNV